MRTRILTIIGLAIYCLIVFLPPMIHGYVYPNIGDDSAEHLRVLDWLKSDASPTMGYLGYVIMGYPIVWISNLTNINVDPLYLWFNYLSLALVGITLYFVMSQLVNKQTGWFALVLSLFCTQGLFFQFYFGQIFNIINIGIILPLLIFFVVRYSRYKKIYQLVLVIIFAGLFGSFHISGIYLPFVAGFIIVSYVAYIKLRKKKMDIRMIVLGISIVLLSAVAFWVIVQNKEQMVNAILFTMGTAMSVPLEHYMLDIVSPTIFVIFALSIVFINDVLENMNNESKMLVGVLSCVGVLLAVSAFGKLSLDPWRQALDFATIFALVLAIFIGLLMSRKANKLIVIILVVAIGFGSFHSLSTWFGYNSAIRLADKQAIAYVNSLNRGSYNCSAQVAPRIYDRFMTLAKYEKATDADGFVAPILITRDLPMTPRSDPTNIWYDGHGIEPDDDYVLLRGFSDGKVTVKVYENIGNGVIVPIGN